MAHHPDPFPGFDDDGDEEWPTLTPPTDPFPGFDDDGGEEYDTEPATDSASVLGPDGRVRVLADQCDTCVFRPGNPMRLPPGRLKDLIDHNRSNHAGLTCHETLPAWPTATHPAWCRGFYDRYDTASRRLAQLLGITEVPPPPTPDMRTAGAPPQSTRPKQANERTSSSS